MTIGDRIRIVTEEEYRIMSPPRRPKGEKPATTIRILRRQLATAQHTIHALQMDRADKEKVIAGYDVQLSEAQDEAANIMDRWRFEAESFSAELIAAKADKLRLAYLEGYHARSQEILPHDPAKTHRGAGAGDPQNLQDGAQGRETARQETGPAGTGGGTGGEIWRRGADYPARPERRSVEGIEVTEVARDAMQSELARHRR